MSVELISQLGWAMYEVESRTESDDDDLEESSFIREPLPMLPSFAGSLDEEEMRNLHGWHVEANNEDREKARKCQREADALRAKAKELDAEATKYMDRVMHGEGVVRGLHDGINFQECIRVTRSKQAEQQRVMQQGKARCKRPHDQNNGVANNMMQPPSKRQMIHLPPVAIRDHAFRSKVSSDEDPRDWFAHTVEDHPHAKGGHPTHCKRMVSRYMPKTQILIYIDGSCLNQNSRTDVQSRRAGCAVVYGTMPLSGQMTTHPSGLCFRLEDKGWDGKPYAATSNRAELRAATAALECRLWGTEGWRQATIATDSTYVVDGITDWVVKWQAREWTKFNGEDVANKDLWKRLLHLVKEQARHGCEVVFWHINRAYNDQADEWAKSAADQPEIERYKEFDLMETEATYRPRIMD